MQLDTPICSSSICVNLRGDLWLFGTDGPDYTLIFSEEGKLRMQQLECSLPAWSQESGLWSYLVKEGEIYLKRSSNSRRISRRAYVFNLRKWSYLC